MRSVACRISPTMARAETSQNEQMRKVPSLPDSPSSVSSVTVAQHVPVLGQLVADRVDGVAQPLVGAGQEPEHGREQGRGVQGVGVVVLAQHPPLADAVLQDVGADLLRGRGPASAPARRRRGCRPAWRRGPARPSTSAWTRRSAAARRGPPRSPGPARATTPGHPRPGTSPTARAGAAGACCAGCAAGSSPAPPRRRRSGAGRTRRCRSAPGRRPRTPTAPHGWTRSGPGARRCRT